MRISAVETRNEGWYPKWQTWQSSIVHFCRNKKAELKRKGKPLRTSLCVSEKIGKMPETNAWQQNGGR